MATQKGNEKISKKRSAEWKKKLASGKLDARLNPTQLRVKRVAKFLSQSDVAENFGLSLATYGAIERGFRTIKPQVAEGLAKLLGASQTALFKKNSQGKLVASSVK